MVIDVIEIKQASVASNKALRYRGQAFSIFIACK